VHDQCNVLSDEEGLAAGVISIIDSASSEPQVIEVLGTGM